ncbi:MAG: amidohydrolase [Oscillospiraceae bacterium]|nr:amidohydrolase [Oscillospiraceae bacterium]
MTTLSEALFQYAVSARRTIHEYPEVGFELDRTVDFVCSQLEQMGIPHTTKYGKGSVVGYLGTGDSDRPTLAIRADMDALPVQEKTDLPYASKIDGQMHACGHDSHTAILLCAAKILKAHEAELACNVRLVFQPSEEGAISGARMMVENGVMDGVDAIICTHCENTLETGIIGVCPGDYMAACIPLRVTFLGRTAHAALPQGGIDAIAMAAEFYARMRPLVEQEAAGKPFIWSVGRFEGGHAHNVIADHCEMDISFRFYDLDFAERVHKQAVCLADEIAASRGGTAQVDWHISTYPVYNDPALNQQLVDAVTALGDVPVQEMPARMTSEDFAWYLRKAPGLIFRFGTRNEAMGCTALAHRNDFRIDEDGMKSAIRAFAAFALNFGKNKK